MLSAKVGDWLNSITVRYEIYKKSTSPCNGLKLYQILEPLFKMGEIYSIVLQKNVLTISLRTEAHHFEIFENLLKN